MGDWLAALDLGGLKPLAQGLLFPPVPFLVLVLLGARWRVKRPLQGWSLVLAGCLGLWFSTTPWVSQGLSRALLEPPPALDREERAELRRSPRTAIVVLGGGRRAVAPEYGLPSLKPRTAERLRYGLWLARETGLPVAFSGGVGHGAVPGATEGEVAARVAREEFGRPLKWVEDRSRDTRENARMSVELLKEAGIERIVLVTQAYHMPRAFGHFSREGARVGVRITPAPMGQVERRALTLGDFMPSGEAYAELCDTLHEWVGRWVGA